MEKRIAGIVRWLERCLRACKSGALESALMDAECARADIELLRNEVWKKLERQHSANSRRRRSGLPWLPAKAAFLAMTAVLAAATPVAFLESAPQGERALREEQDSLSLVWVTPDEKMLLSNLRKHLSDGDSLASITSASTVASPQQGEEKAEEKKEKTEPQPVQAAAVEKNGMARKTPSSEPEVREVPGSETPGISYDRILSLVQTGEKAMKQQASIITIERQPQ
jgi:hypothetical protein